MDRHPSGEGFTPEPTFPDSQLERTFRNEGWVKVPFLANRELVSLRHAVAAFVEADASGFMPTMYSADLVHRRRVDAVCRAATAAAVGRLLPGHRSFVANLLVKPPTPETEVGVHQDWSFVEEPTFVSATIWCPLVDTETGNGTLEVAPRTHLVGPTWRGSPRLPTPFDGMEALVGAHMVSIPCRAGEAVVYDHRLVHRSPPNLSAEPRPAVGIGIAPKGVPLVHYHQDQDGLITRYDVPDDFLVDLRFGDPPHRCLGSSPMSLPNGHLTAEQLEAVQGGPSDGYHRSG